jgi:hypothetical protein
LSLLLPSSSPTDAPHLAAFSIPDRGKDYRVVLGGEPQDFHFSVLLHGFFSHKKDSISNSVFKVILSTVFTDLSWDVLDDHDSLAPEESDCGLTGMSPPMFTDQAPHEVLLVLKSDSQTVGSGS